jgi:glyoxylase-like metal-dependent hydrolase (beta-lactamase superfamily II)
MMQATTAVVGGSLFAGLMPSRLSGAVTAANAEQAGAAPQDRIAQMRAQAAGATLQTLKLRDNISMISGAGGNIVALDGPDGKVVVDSSYLTVAAKLRHALDSLSGAPLKILINTHWHLDHTDGNAPLHDRGALILAHENTRKRLSTPQYMAALDMHVPPSPPDALPQQTLKESFRLYFNSEELALNYIPPAHTDTDIYIHYQKGNVLHMGDVWFNGFYPFIDASTGGHINGMVAGASSVLGFVDGDTKIVPGHGPVGDKAALTKYRDMLATVRDRVQKLKTSGKTAEETIHARPTADLDAVWGHGFLGPDVFVGLVYSTLG